MPYYIDCICKPMKNKFFKKKYYLFWIQYKTKMGISKGNNIAKRNWLGEERMMMNSWRAYESLHHCSEVVPHAILFNNSRLWRGLGWNKQVFGICWWEKALKLWVFFLMFLLKWKRNYAFCNFLTSAPETEVLDDVTWRHQKKKKGKMNKYRLNH